MCRDMDTRNDTNNSEQEDVCLENGNTRIEEADAPSRNDVNVNNNSSEDNATTAYPPCLDNDVSNHDIEEAKSSNKPITHRRSSSLDESTPRHHHRRTQSQEDAVQVQHYIRTLSSVLSSDPQEASADEELLQSVLRQAGESSYGISAIEVYTFDDPRLLPVDWWFRSDEMSSGTMEEDEDLVLQPEICIPGVDLVGALWQHTTMMKRVPSMNSLKNRSWSVSFRQQRVKKEPRGVFPQPPSFGNGRQSLHWRELKSAIEDADAIHGPRLEAMQSAGFERAAGVGFDCDGTRGMVVYYAKQGVDETLLSAVANETFLRRTASLVGSVLTMAESRRASVAFQRQSTSDVTAGGVEVDTVPATRPSHGMQTPLSNSHCIKVRKRVVAWYRKLWGGGTQIPQGMPLVETLWTIFGVFVGLLTVASVNELFVSKSDYYLIMAPFGALATLQYGLTSAPAAQPRAAILGHTVALAISLAFTYIPEMILPVWLRQLVAPSFAIGAMVKLGITHPPAGAFSVIFSEGNHGWGFYGLAVLCSIISVIPATIVNNMSQKRQYPTYWGFLPESLSRRLRKAVAGDAIKE